MFRDPLNDGVGNEDAERFMNLCTECSRGRYEKLVSRSFFETTRVRHFQESEQGFAERKCNGPNEDDFARQDGELMSLVARSSRTVSKLRTKHDESFPEQIENCIP